MRRWVTTAAVVVVAGVLIAAAAAVQGAREIRFPPADINDEALYLTSGAAARRLTVSLNPLAADVYWIRAIQYYGGAKRRLNARAAGAEPPPALERREDYDELYPLLDLTTSLDPRFNIAYRFGAVFLAEPYPSGPGRPDLAVKLLEKGLRERPDKWEYMEDIGFVYYWYERDYRQAAGWFDRASQIPGAPVWLRALAASTLAKGGDRASARLMWTAIRDSAEVDWLKKQAEQRLLQFQALDEIERLQSQVRAGAVRQFPPDPTGVPYVLASDGRVSVSRDSPLYPLPEEPPQRTNPTKDPK